MCFQTELSLTYKQLENRFNAMFAEGADYKPGRYSGFSYPRTPVIANRDSVTLQMMQWGLIPTWAKDTEIKKYTLNARLETLRSKPSFRDSVSQRCLVAANAFYEWQWLDPKGKSKKKYVLTLPKGETFGLAGLWNTWTDRETGEVIDSYTIITTEANDLMSRIHNSKKRMPVIIDREYETQWLETGEIKMQNDRLQANGDPLLNIPGIGKSMAEDLRILGIESVSDLTGRDPQRMYDRLCEIRNTVLDRCVLYVFRCAVYYAETNNTEPEKIKWWNWKENENESGIFRKCN